MTAADSTDTAAPAGIGSQTLLRFGQCEVDAAARRLWREGRPAPIEPKPLELLLYLIAHRRRVVSSGELLERLWPGEAVGTAALARAVMKARRALGGGVAGGDAASIRSVPRIGYRFVAPMADEAPVPPEPAAAPPAGALSIALLPFENATGDAALHWLELGLMGLVVQGLAGCPGLAPVPLASLTAALDELRSAPGTDRVAAVRRSTGARVVVRTRVSRVRNGYRLDFEPLGAPASGAAQVSARQPAVLAGRMVEALGRSLCPDAPPASLAGSAPRDPLAGESFARGLDALAQHLWNKAANLFKLVLDVEPDHLPAQLELLRALGNLGDPRTLRHARGLLARARRENNRQLAAQVHQAIGRLYLQRGLLDKAEHSLDTALSLADGRGTPDWTARALMMQASVAVHRGAYERALEAAQRMEEQCRRSGNQLLPVAGLNFQAIVASARGEYERAVALSAEAARRARELRALSYLVDATDNAAWDLARLGRLAEAAAQAEESVSAAIAGGAIDHACASTPVLCWIYWQAREPAAAARVVAALPGPDALPRPEFPWAARGLLALQRQDPEGAVLHLRKALERVRSLGDRYVELQMLPWLVDALSLADRYDEAEAELAQADAPRLAGSPLLQAQALHARALLAHARGHAGAALALLDRLIDRRPAPLWLGWAAIDAAWLLAEQGQGPAAEQRLELVPDALAAHPLVLATRARAHHAAGARAHAGALLRASLAAFGESAPDWLRAFGALPEGAAWDTAPRLPSRF